MGAWWGRRAAYSTPLSLCDALPQKENGHASCWIFAVKRCRFSQQPPKLLIFKDNKADDKASAGVTMHKARQSVPY
jgi:hypothetical protein